MTNFYITTINGVSKPLGSIGTLDSDSGGYTYLADLNSIDYGRFSYDPIAQDLIIGSVVGAVYDIDPSYSLVLRGTTFPVSNVNFIAFKSDGTMYIMSKPNPSDSILYRANRATLTLNATYFLPNTTNYYGIAFDESENLYCMTEPISGNSVIIRLTLPTLVEEVICDLTESVGGGIWKSFRNLTYSGGKLYTTQLDTGEIIPIVSVDIASKTAEVAGYYDSAPDGDIIGLTIFDPFTTSTSTSTATTSSTSTGTTTSTSTATTSSTSTSTGTTTSTTTEAIPVKIQTVVQTVLHNDDGSEKELCTFDRGAFCFGTLAPGETSKSLIVSLKSNVSMGNIKLALIENGGIDVDTNFGYDVSSSVDPNMFLRYSFSGVSSSATDVYNISVDNLSQNTSEYVYLNLTVPRNHNVEKGVVRYKWYFDCADIRTL